MDCVGAKAPLPSKLKERETLRFQTTIYTARSASPNRNRRANTKWAKFVRSVAVLGRDVCCKDRGNILQPIETDLAETARMTN